MSGKDVGTFLFGKTANRAILLLLSFFVLTSCGSATETNVDSLEPSTTTSTQKANLSFEFPSFQEFVFCNIKDRLVAVDDMIIEVKDGVSSYKDLAEPMQELTVSLKLSADMFKRENLLTENPELLEWTTEENIARITQKLDEEYLWFAKTRVRLMDYGEYSASSIKSRSESLSAFIKDYCSDK
jgi:hypothetical protein